MYLVWFFTKERKASIIQNTSSKMMWWHEYKNSCNSLRCKRGRYPFFCISIYKTQKSLYFFHVFLLTFFSYPLTNGHHGVMYLKSIILCAAHKIAIWSHVFEVLKSLTLCKHQIKTTTITTNLMINFVFEGNVENSKLYSLTSFLIFIK